MALTASCRGRIELLGYERLEAFRDAQGMVGELGHEIGGWDLGCLEPRRDIGRGRVVHRQAQEAGTDEPGCARGDDLADGRVASGEMAGRVAMVAEFV